MVKDKDRILHTNSHNILNRWQNHFCQLLHIYWH